MSSEDKLREIFHSFAQFGSKNSLKGSVSAVTIDNSKFAKLCKETKVVNKACTTTDVDIIFNKVKPKTERRIDFDAFKEALRQLAEKRFPQAKTDGERFDEIVKLVVASGGPGLSGGTVPESSAVVGRLTDTSQYTGSHKQRFDADGKGKGMEGRESNEGIHDISKITRSEMRGPAAPKSMKQ